MEDVDMNAGGFDAMADASGAKGSAEKKTFKNKSVLPVTIKQINKGTDGLFCVLHLLRICYSALHISCVPEVVGNIQVLTKPPKPSICQQVLASRALFTLTTPLPRW